MAYYSKPLTASDFCRFTTDNGKGQRCASGHITLLPPPHREKMTKAFMEEAASRRLAFILDYNYPEMGHSLSAAASPPSYNDDLRNSLSIIADTYNAAARRVGLLNSPEMDRTGGVNIRMDNKEF